MLTVNPSSLYAAMLMKKTTPRLGYVFARNYSSYSNGNFCKGTYVRKIIVEAKVDARAVLLKKSTGFSCMSVTASLLCFGCFAAR